MIEKSYYPSGALAQYVSVIWVGKATQLSLDAQHHAALFTELIFNYGDHFMMEGETVSSQKNRYDHQLISGLKTHPFRTEVAGAYASIGLIMKPYCYGILKELLGTNELDALSMLLHQAFFEDEKGNYELAEEALLTLFQKTEIDQDFVKFEKFTTNQLLNKGALGDFNATIPISQKSFIQKFKKHYQLTPGNYIKLKKVNTAISFLKQGTQQTLGHAGLDAGFYDQSHFIKLFKQFCGTSPKDFVNRLG